MAHSTASQRPPVGVVPYRVPPLSGLYRMRYRSPAPADSADSASAAAAARHAAVDSQLRTAKSLSDGEVDLFALYSVCEMEAVECTHCTLHAETTLKTAAYRLRQSYTLTEDDSGNSGTVAGTPSPWDAAAPSSSALLADLERGWYVFFFPMSECGRLLGNLLVCAGDALVAGDVAECDFDNDGCLRPVRTASAHKLASPGEAPAAQEQGPPSQQRWKPLFYYVVSPVPVHWSAKASTELHISVTWRCTPPAEVTARTHSTANFSLLYSYYCAPRAPDALTCRAQFPDSVRLRLVRSPNCDAAVLLRNTVTERTAEVRVETADGKPLDLHRHPRDYTFALYFFFGDDTAVLETTSTLAAAVVGVVALLLVWVFLTKDLVL